MQRRGCRTGGRRKDPGVTIGLILIGAGLVLLFLCIPGWAWAALAGIALIAAGFFLVRL